MSRKYFGTDGIRGVANSELSPQLAFKLGLAAGRWMSEAGVPKRVVLCRDTRRSGAMLGAALASGFSSAGADVVAVGVAPTPCASYLLQELGFGVGAVVSASHNPAPDNGIKLFGHDGRKLSDEQERAIERLMEEEGFQPPTGAEVGNLIMDASIVAGYSEYLARLLPEGLSGMRIAVDAANGAAFSIAPAMLKMLGAEVVSCGDIPNGMNINEGCGATKPETIQALTKESGADLGVAFDGDADRAVFSDSKGRLINGDRVMAIWCSHWHAAGKLEPPIAVGTVMSNGGFEAYLASKGVSLERTSVGDRYVSERLLATGARVGGEQSGHLIFPEFGKTGDGLITALELLRVLRREDRPLSSFYEDYDPWPQLLINVSVRSKEGWNEGPLVSSALRQAEECLGGHGRLVVRPSGTQPMIRVMVEASEIAARDATAAGILNAMREELGGEVYSEVDLTYALGD